nr:PREDICTED: uncharacterized protein LOC109035610 [Bemisia tabaci]
MAPVARHPREPREHPSGVGGGGSGVGRRRRDSLAEYSRVGRAMSEASSSSSGSENSIRDEIKAARNYVDPWDLENYVYLKRQCSDSSEPVLSLGTGGDHDSTHSEFYYVSKAPPPRTPRRPESLAAPEGALYEPPYDLALRMENLDLSHGRKSRRQSTVYSHAFPFPENHMELHDGDCCDVELMQNPYALSEFRHVEYPPMPPYLGSQRPQYRHPLPPPPQIPDSPPPPPLYIYQKSKMNKALVHPRPRRISQASSLSSGDDYCSSSDTTTGTSLPLLPETRIGMSTFGHMKIDYSWNWNNLDRYIAQY